MIRKGDKILLAVVAVSIVVGYGLKLYNDYKYKASERTAIIEIDGKLYGKYDLRKTPDQTLKLNLQDQQNSIVEFKEGRVRVQYADCPDKVCVRTGWISMPGEIIVCLPYRVIIKISGERQDVDVSAN